MHKIFLLICCIFFFINSNSQRIPKKYRKYFNNCCEVKNTKLDSLIEIDGYYNTGYILDGFPDTSYSTILFYKDGSQVSGWGNRQKLTNMEYLSEVCKNGRNDYFYKNAYWGRYKIINDTIIVINIWPGSFMRAVSVDERTYKIINRTQILELSFRDLTNSNIGDNVPDIRYFPANFTKVPCIPSNKYSWLLHKKCVDCK